MERDKVSGLVLNIFTVVLYDHLRWCSIYTISLLQMRELSVPVPNISTVVLHDHLS